MPPVASFVSSLSAFASSSSVWSSSSFASPMPTRLLEVILERSAKLIRVGGSSHLRQRLDQLLLCAAKIADLLDQHVLKRIESHPCPPRIVCSSYPRYPSVTCQNHH